MAFLMKIAERVVVMNVGAKFAEGKPEEIARDARVIDVYLGRSRDIKSVGRPIKS
jgi:ABC-type branched-subunit amino acid transport system ATPase component